MTSLVEQVKANQKLYKEEIISEFTQTLIPNIISDLIEFSKKSVSDEFYKKYTTNLDLTGMTQDVTDLFKQRFRNEGFRSIYIGISRDNNIYSFGVQFLI